MSRNYDNWERLVRVVLRREEDRRLAYVSSSSYSSTTESDYEYISDDGRFRLVTVESHRGEPFSHSSERRKSRSKYGSSSRPSRQAGKSIPRIERLNAVKNIDYEYPPSTSVNSASLRIGESYGQFESIYEMMGFSGIGDFGIPVAEYGAIKVRSSAAPSLISQKIEDSYGDVREISSGSDGITNLTKQKTNGRARGVIPPLVQLFFILFCIYLLVVSYLIDSSDSFYSCHTFGLSWQRVEDGRFLLDHWYQRWQQYYEILPLTFANKEAIFCMILEFLITKMVKLDSGYRELVVDESHLYIFFQLVSKGSLLSLYQTYNLKDSVVSAYTRQILHGLKYLHDKNVIHRDIRCANILVDVDGSVKLADFGLAKVVRSLGYGLAADIWSLGCTVLEMLTRRFPYSNMEPVSKAVVSGSL